jgi:hypothetical protein
MSNDNLWEEEEVFDDKPEEAQTKYNEQGRAVIPPSTAQPIIIPPQQQPQQRHQRIEEAPAYEEEVEATEESEEEDYSEVLTDANLRLEQGSLYKLIMKHDLFVGVDADPKAIQNVQKAIRKFAREQMEVMLGMRKETAQVEHLQFDFPFNALEVEVIKAMAKTFSKGATENSDAYVPNVIRTTEEVSIAQRQNTLNPIGGSTAPKRSTQVQAPKKRLANKASAPLKRSKLEENIDDLAARLAGDGVSKETIKAGLRRELEEHDNLLNKSIRELTPSQLEERNNQIAQRRGAQVKSQQAIPMPSAEQQAMMIESRVTPGAKPSKLIEMALKMPPTKLLNTGEQ